VTLPPRQKPRGADAVPMVQRCAARQTGDPAPHTETRGFEAPDSAQYYHAPDTADHGD
jgi:hypothetical protein